jgi:phosphoribosylformylglycinamidine cyclo-ligase
MNQITTSNESKESKYAAAGVSIAEGDRAVELMKAAVKATYTPAVLAGIGAFGGMIDVSSLKNMAQPVLVASTDGVGTKTMIASTMQRWNTVGADLVNHSVNDILVQGGEPLFFMDYVAAAKLDATKVAEIVGGMAGACKTLGCVLLGGETAEMPGVYHEGHWDVAGTIVGVVDKANALDGSKIKAGDALLALPSSGLHTNGYSLARYVLKDLDWTVPVKELMAQGKIPTYIDLTPAQQTQTHHSLGDLLLAVHVAYLQPYKQLLAAGVAIHGMVHITGGGVTENVPRVLPEGLTAHINFGSWPVPLIFELIARIGQVSRTEQMQVFNMGIGMLIAVPQTDIIKAHTALGDGFVYTVGQVSPRLADMPAVNIVGL